MALLLRALRAVSTVNYAGHQLFKGALPASLLIASAIQLVERLGPLENREHTQPGRGGWRDYAPCVPIATPLHQQLCAHSEHARPASGPSKSHGRSDWGVFDRAGCPESRRLPLDVWHESRFITFFLKFESLIC